jgi:hypothetical protein
MFNAAWEESNVQYTLPFLDSAVYIMNYKYTVWRTKRLKLLCIIVNIGHFKYGTEDSTPRHRFLDQCVVLKYLVIQ